MRKSQCSKKKSRHGRTTYCVKIPTDKTRTSFLWKCYNVPNKFPNNLLWAHNKGLNLESSPNFTSFTKEMAKRNSIRIILHNTMGQKDPNRTWHKKAQGPKLSDVGTDMGRIYFWYKNVRFHRLVLAESGVPGIQNKSICVFNRFKHPDWTQIALCETSSH